MRILVTIDNRLHLFDSYRLFDCGDNTLLFSVRECCWNFCVYNVYNVAGILTRASEFGYIDLSHNLCRVLESPTQYTDNEGLEKELEQQEPKYDEIDINDDDWIRSL